MSCPPVRDSKGLQRDSSAERGKTLQDPQLPRNQESTDQTHICGDHDKEPEDLERMANMDLLDVLVEQGDILTVAREVQHWMYFPSGPSRALFRDAAVAAGFKIVSESSSEGRLPFGISVARTQSIEQESIDRTVVELLNLSLRFDGEYDGWVTPIVTH